MERIFCKDKKGFCDCLEDCRKCKFTKGNGVIDGNIAHDVLATLFGLDYDLDRLRELVEADSMVGKQLYFTKWFSPGARIANPPIQRTVTSYSRLRNGVILLHLKDGELPLRLIGDFAYKTREAAESALAKEANQ